MHVVDKGSSVSLPESFLDLLVQHAEKINAVEVEDVENLLFITFDEMEIPINFNLEGAAVIWYKRILNKLQNKEVIDSSFDSSKPFYCCLEPEFHEPPVHNIKEKDRYYGNAIIRKKAIREVKRQSGSEEVMIVKVAGSTFHYVVYPAKGEILQT